MSDMEEKYINALYGAYCDVYEDQLEGADDDYLKYFMEEFSPPNEPWGTKDEAVSAFKSLYDELREDRIDAREIVCEYGVTQEIITYFGLDL